MKISCTQENLNQGLSVISHIANKNTNLPILSNILVKVEDKVVTLAATNLEIGVSIQVRAKVESEGDFTVEAKLFSDYISLLPKERVDLELDGDSIKIKCQKQKTKIKGQVATDFPLIPTIKKENPYLIKAKDLKQIISEVAFAASKSETRPEISGVLLNFIGDKLVMAATDTYRLAEKKIKLIESNENQRRLIVPVKTLMEVARILGIFKDEASLENSENIEIYISDNQIMFSFNNIDLISRLIDGMYPEYEQIIPPAFKNKVTINRQALIKAVKTSSLFTKNSVCDVKLEFLKEKNEIIVTSSSAQTGENSDDLEAQIEGESLLVVFNYNYLLDGLNNINGDEVVMEMNSPSAPILLRAKELNDYLYIVMPIKQEATA